MRLAMSREALVLTFTIPPAVPIRPVAHPPDHCGPATASALRDGRKNDGRAIVSDQKSRVIRAPFFVSAHSLPRARSRQNVCVQVIHLLTAARTGIDYRAKARFP